MNGAELERIKAAEDPRIKQRIYFYVNGGRGITPESDVGAHAHRATLNNLYDLDNDPKDLAVGQSDANLVESAILDAGYDGYIANSRGVAIMLGQRNMVVEYAGTGRQTAEQPVQATPSTYGALQRLVANNRALPAGKMPGASWKRIMSALMPEVDVSHLDDAKDYYRDGIVKRPKRADNTRRDIAPQTTAPSGAVSFSERRVLDQVAGKTITRTATIAETGETVQLKNQDAAAAIKQLRSDIEALDALRLCAGV